MDPKNLSDGQLEAALQQLQAASPAGAKAADQLQEAMNELQVYRMELEMKNRALQENQAELENSIRRQNDLYDFSPIGYLTLSQAGLIDDANLTIAELLQAERTQLRGQRFRRFLNQSDGDRLILHLDQVLTGKPAVTSVTLRPARPGVPLAVQLSSRLAPQLSPGAPQVLTAITDISALQEVQHELEEVNREQESFCHSISHDLRSPLVTIANLSSLLLSEFAPGMDETAQECLKRIHFATQRMDQMLSDLLEYSRVSRSSLQGVVIDVEQLVEDILSQHQGVIQTAQGEISVKRPLPRVRGSPEALRQVLANLLTNALKFVPPGQTPRVEIWSEETGTTAVVVVRDHGIGIAPEHRQRVFGIFERLHGQSQYPGSGVGLAIVRRAVERMGGRIWLDSEVGQGCKFSVELPKA